MMYNYEEFIKEEIVGENVLLLRMGWGLSVYSKAYSQNQNI